jgi:hypothetical protein
VSSYGKAAYILHVKFFTRPYLSYKPQIKIVPVSPLYASVILLHSSLPSLFSHGASLHDHCESQFMLPGSLHFLYFSVSRSVAR